MRAHFARSLSLAVLAILTISGRSACQSRHRQMTPMQLTPALDGGNPLIEKNTPDRFVCIVHSRVVYLPRADKSSLRVRRRRQVVKKQGMLPAIKAAVPPLTRIDRGRAHVTSQGRRSEQLPLATPSSPLCWLRLRWHPIEEYLSQRPDPIGQPGRHRRGTGPPAFRRTRSVCRLAVN